MSTEVKIAASDPQSEESSNPSQVDLSTDPSGGEQGAGTAPNIPEQFNGDVTKLVESWQEQQRTITTLNQAKAATEASAAGGELIPKGDLDRYTQEIFTSPEGKLSEQSYQELAARGLSRPMVDVYADGIKARKSQAEGAIHEAAGGSAALAEMVQWATQGGMTQTEIAGLSAAMESGNIGSATLAVQALRQKYEAVNGRAPALLQATEANPNMDVYLDLGQLMADMRSPQYQDPMNEAFRKKVHDKMARSGGKF